jgi:hypothetical protein
MKRLCAILILLVVMILFGGCSKTNVVKNADVSLIFLYEEENIRVTLEDDEAENVIAILDGNDYDPGFYGIPACGFSRSYAIEIDGVRYMLAWDSCGVLCAESSQASKSYINISDSDRDIMEVIFASRMPG